MFEDIFGNFRKKLSSGEQRRATMQIARPPGASSPLILGGRSKRCSFAIPQRDGSPIMQILALLNFGSLTRFPRENHLVKSKLNREKIIIG